MKKAKYNEIPNGYRRNYKKEVVELSQKLAICLGGVLFLVIMFWMA